VGWQAGVDGGGTVSTVFRSAIVGCSTGETVETVSRPRAVEATSLK